MSSLQRQFAASPEVVAETLREVAAMWGADWQPRGNGGRLALPIVQGLRRGFVEGTVALDPAASGCSLRFVVEETSLEVNRSALAILILGGLGGLTLVFWPLSPVILRLAPVGAVLAIVAWLMVVSRLRNSSPEQFLDLVRHMAEHD